MNHEVFLADLVTSIPELQGAFLFSPPTLLASYSGHAISHCSPLAIIKKITAVIDMASVHLPDIMQIQVTFDHMILSARLLPDQKWLLLLHTPQLSTGMINLTLQLALNNSYQDSAIESSPSAPAVNEQPAAGPETINIDTLALMAAGAPLAKPLNDLQDALAHCIGPAAFPVFQDILSVWCRQHIPALATLKYLLPLLEREVEDSNNTFHNTIKDLLPLE